MEEEKNKELTKYPDLSEKGFDEEEILTLTKWLDEGKPGLSKFRAERMGDIFILGYSCKEINKWFPEYPIEVLLFARAHYEWDKLRSEYLMEVQKNTLEAALATRMESIKFLSELMSATHLKWRKQILDYIANPERTKPPECLPNGIYQYGQAMSLLKDLVTPPSQKGPAGKEIGSGATPLVSIKIQNGRDKPDVIIQNSTQEDIKKALIEEVKNETKE